MYTIRALTRDELSALGPLWDRAGLPWRPQGRDRLANLIALWERDAGEFIGAFADERLVGAVVASHDRRRGWINRLAVDPSHRHRGVGRQLIAAAESTLRARGLTVIAALIEQDNAPSRALFAAMGYVHMPEVLYYSKRESPDA
ncbi:MAG TPA: GNAT family N-acetyltransferase [bacterium]|nr:GNAT family N-acetyltransferase [bacterium]